jgi:caffeoyl-CoA O-methyltransferase
LITIDINEELENFTRKFINESVFSTQIDYRIGDAAEIIPTLPNGIDLVFIDADKVNYQKYYDLVFDKISVGGYILSDNVLWDGKVADEEKVDKKTKILRSFNQNATQDSRTENILLPIRDGLMLSRKLA